MSFSNWIRSRRNRTTPAAPIGRSLQDEHFTCLNHALMQQLDTIGERELYMRCFFHFANLYTGANGSRLAFPKRYDDICSEWLGGLCVYARTGPSSNATNSARHLGQLAFPAFFPRTTSARPRGGTGSSSFLPAAVNIFGRLRSFLPAPRPGRIAMGLPCRPAWKSVRRAKLAYPLAEKRIWAGSCIARLRHHLG